MSAVLTHEEPMAKKAGRPKKPGSGGKPVRIHSDVAKMAQRVADYRGLPLSDYLSDLARPVVVREYRKMIAETEAETEGSE
jgi:hypothetical protein